MDTIELLVGRIGKPHGIRGAVTIDVRTDEPEKRFALGSVLRCRAQRGDAAFTHLTVSGTKWHQGILLASFEEIADRNAAETARGLLLMVERAADEIPDDPDEFYDHQLVGLAAFNTDGVALGAVTAVLHGAAQDLLSIRTPDGRDALVPFVAALVPQVDLEARRVVIADRPGLVTPLPDDEPDSHELDSHEPDAEEER